MPVLEARAPALADHVAGAGTPLLLLHGGSGSHRHWSRIVGPLSKSFRVHAPDLPGYGESPAVPDDVDGDAYVELAAASLDSLAPGSVVDLVGFSFGGAVAVGVARIWGLRVRRLTLIGPGGFGRPVGRELNTRSRAATDGSDAARREVVRHNLAAVMFADPAHADEAVLEMQLWNLAHAQFDSLRVSYQDRVVADVARVGCPVQAIWGAQDVLAHPTPQQRAERLRAARPDVQVHFVPGGGHWVQYECPDAVVRLLTDFHAPVAAHAENP